jgi:hypothetical protein
VVAFGQRGLKTDRQRGLRALLSIFAESIEDSERGDRVYAHIQNAREWPRPIESRETDLVTSYITCGRHSPRKKPNSRFEARNG